MPDGERRRFPGGAIPLLEEAKVHSVMDDGDYARLTHPVAALAKEYPHRYATLRHRHSRGQLVYAMQGVMTVRTNQGLWVLPPNRGVWIPAFEAHQIFMQGHVSMRTLYIAQRRFSSLADRCSLINVNPLLRELILEAVEEMRRDGTTPKYDRLLAVLEDHIHAIGAAPIQLPMPYDERLKNVADPLLRGEGEDRTMKEWAQMAGASVRNLRRLFVKETGMSFGKWRQQARLAMALHQLAANQPVTTVALNVGYDTPSAFINAFKKNFGLTPTQYFQ